MTPALLILALAAGAAALAVWFLYALGRPSPTEPRFLYRLRRRPSASPECAALLARGLFHPHLLRTGAEVGFFRLGAEGAVWRLALFLILAFIYLYPALWAKRAAAAAGSGGMG